MAAPTINATAGGSQANSYVTLAWAGQYFADGLDDERWEAFTEAQRSRALIAATRQLQSMRLWGSKATTSQALHFPRTRDGYQAVAGEAFTSDYDSAVQLDRTLIIAGSSIITDDTAGTTTFTADSDYTIDETNGTITVLSTGTMDDATTYYASYSYTGAPPAIEQGICEQALWLLEQRANPELIDHQDMARQGVRYMAMDGMVRQIVNSGPQGQWGTRAWELIGRYVCAVGSIG